MSQKPKIEDVEIGDIVFGPGYSGLVLDVSQGSGSARDYFHFKVFVLSRPSINSQEGTILTWAFSYLDEVLKLKDGASQAPGENKNRH